jgi:Mn2+/Fe2+ NRAMP family transporter
VHLDPIKVLFWAAVLNGAVAVPVMAFMMILSRNPKAMGQFTLPPYLQLIGWLATAMMLFAAVGMIVTLHF